MQNITEPTLVLDKQICQANIKRMADKAQQHGLALKPHMKTHQSAEIGQWMKNAGIRAITVSSVKMAQYFTEHGWDDITIAFPCNIRQLDEINQLAASVSVTLLINRLDTLQILDQKLTNKVKAYIEIDTGSQRSGLEINQISEITTLIDSLAKAEKVEWVGFYSHPGHSYSSRSKDEILQVHRSVIQQFQKLRKELKPAIEGFEICVGDTPCCSVGDEFEGINAISPGNFVFFDLMQHQIGSCNVNDIAVALYCPIVDKYPKRNELIIHGGAIHFSKESMNEDDYTHYGKVATYAGEYWGIVEETYLKRLSQEHGVVSCPESVFNEYNTGDVIPILPVHSCLTANLMNEFSLQNGVTIKML